jgi:hypothetical protein
MFGLLCSAAIKPSVDTCPWESACVAQVNNPAVRSLRRFTYFSRFIIVFDADEQGGTEFFQIALTTSSRVNEADAMVRISISVA